MTELQPERSGNRRWLSDDDLRSAVRLLAFFGLLGYGFAIVMFLGEGTPGAWQRTPFILPGAPFGTYAENTQLLLLTMGAGFGLLFVGSILAFRWQRMAAGTLIAGGAVHLFSWILMLRDTTRPHDNGPIVWLILFVLPPFALAYLLLITSGRGPVRPAASGSAGGA